MNQYQFNIGMLQEILSNEDSDEDEDVGQDDESWRPREKALPINPRPCIPLADSDSFG